MTATDFIIAPFRDYEFMRRALAACLILSLGGVPLGLFMTLRRMTLVGDAIGHAILPGVAAAFMAAGLSVWPMTVGGLVMGVGVGLVAAALAKSAKMDEDAAFTVLYLVSLAAGVVMISARGSSVDLLHLLFGNVLFIGADSLVLVTFSACVTVFFIAAFYRRLVIDCFDPDFINASRRKGAWAGFLFFCLLALNMVSAFQALGTLMSLGLMIIPAVAARFWTRRLDAAMALGVLFGILSSFIGLLVSYYADVPSGPAVVLSAGAIAAVSVLLCRCGSVLYISDPTN